MSYVIVLRPRIFDSELLRKFITKCRGLGLNVLVEESMDDELLIASPYGTYRGERAEIFMKQMLALR